MSVAEIVEKMPELSFEELELVWETAGRLREQWVLDPSPELLAAIDEAEADTSPGIPIEVVMERMKTWAGK